MKVQSDYNYSNCDKPAFKAECIVPEKIINDIETHYDYHIQYMDALKSNLERIPTKDIFSISRFMPSSSINNKSGYMITNETNGATVKFFDEPIENCKTKFHNRLFDLHTKNLAEAIYSTIMKNLGKLLSDASVLEGVEFIEPDLSGYGTADVNTLSDILHNEKMPLNMKKQALKLLEDNKDANSFSLETRTLVKTILNMFNKKL